MISAYTDTDPDDGDLLYDQEVYCPTYDDYGVANVSADREGSRFDCPLCHQEHQFESEDE